MKIRYSIQELLAFRGLPETAEVPTIDLPQEKPEAVRVLPDRNAVVSFRKAIVGSEAKSVVKFVQDVDVPIDCIVHVFNLTSNVGWPHLKTFCRKAVGVEPMDLRMMRRRTPCEARLIFHSKEDAATFLEKVPANNWLRGSIPRFEMEYNVPAWKSGVVGRSSAENRLNVVDVAASPAVEAEVASSDESGEEEVAVATAVMCRDEYANRGKLQSYDFTEEVQDSCFKGGKLPSAECNIPVYSAVVQPEGKKAVCSDKQSKGHGRGGRAQGQARRNKAVPSVRAICVAHMPASVAANM